MWNLLAIGTDSNIYQPSSFIGAFIDTSYTESRAEYAYDKPGGKWDDYPYSTWASLRRNGSSVAGTGDTSTAVLSGWGTLAKANFTSATLYIGLSIRPVESRKALTDVSTASIKIEISYDSGSTWTLWKLYGIYNNGILYPELAACYTILTTDVITRDYLNNAQLNLYIPSASFSSGLSDLQIKISGSTVKSTFDGGLSQSASEIYDARVVVN